MREAAKASAPGGRHGRRTERQALIAYLTALAGALQGRAITTLKTKALPELHVVSLGEPLRTGIVVCRRTPDGWRYAWTWWSVTELPLDDTDLAAGTITVALAAERLAAVL
jgi:hypothetical protein